MNVTYVLNNVICRYLFNKTLITKLIPFKYTNISSSIENER